MQNNSNTAILTAVPGLLSPNVANITQVANKITVMRCACYIVAQMAGATAGVGLVKAVNSV